MRAQFRLGVGGFAHRADGFAHAHALPHRGHFRALQAGVKAFIAVFMLDAHRVTQQRVAVGLRYRAIGAGSHRRAQRSGDIDGRVRLPQLQCIRPYQRVRAVLPHHIARERRQERRFLFFRFRAKVEALAALALILVISFRQAPGTPVVHEYHLLQMVPYLLVLIGGIAGIQVFVVLLIGIASGAVIMLGTGQTTLWDMLSSMGSGTSGMFETCMVAILVAAMCALIRENGGFTVLLRAIHKIFRGKKGGQLGVGILVALLDIATANNTVAIVMANPIAKQMSEDYGITPRKTASLLDTFSCISQGILPYGAQMLVAISAVHELGYELSAFEIMANLFYPGMLLVSSLIFIFVLPDRKNAESNA